MVSAGKRKVVGQEHQRLAGLGVLEANTAQMFGVILLRIEAIERNRLIADDARARSAVAE